MSEAMLTLSREQIEMCKVFADTHNKDEKPAVLMDPAALSTLCTLALSSIAMREALKPFAEAYTNREGWAEDMFIGGSNLRNSDLRRAAKAYQEQGK